MKKTWFGVGLQSRLKGYLGLVFGFVLLAVFISVYLRKPATQGSRSENVSTREVLQKEVNFYENRIKAAPGSAMDLSALAGVYLKIGKLLADSSAFERAEALALDSLKILSSYNPEANWILAEIAQNRHDFQNAIGIVKKVMGEGKTTSKALALLVTCYLALGNLSEAGRLADQLVDSAPFSGSYALRALVLEAQGRDAEAQLDFKSAIRVDDANEKGESAWIRSIFGRFLFHKRKIKESKDLLREALAKDSGYPFALDLLGQVELSEKQFKKAEKLFQDAFATSKQVIYLVHYARAKRLKGDLQSAKEYYAQAETLIRGELKAGGYGHRLDLAQLLLERGVPGEAKLALELIREELKIRQPAEAYYLLAWSLAGVEQWKEANSAIREALRSGVRRSEYYGLAAKIEKALSNQRRFSFYADLERGQF